jgi:hypothetical protein
MSWWGIAWLACVQKWEPRGCLDSVQLNAIWKCDLPWRMCHVQGRAEEALKNILIGCVKKITARSRHLSSVSL